LDGLRQKVGRRSRAHCVIILSTELAFVVLVQAPTLNSFQQLNHSQYRSSRSTHAHYYKSIFKMSTQYSQMPPKAAIHPTPFQVSIPESKLSEFRALLKLSKISSPTYENLQEDQRFGVSSKWLAEAKDRWENHFDWLVSRSTIKYAVSKNRQMTKSVL
jgi:hypothetical protein